jgi:hypothetical protein
MGPPLCSRKQTPEYGMETSSITCQKEVQNSTIGRKRDVDICFWGGIMASSGTLPRPGHNSEQRGKHKHSLPLCMCVPLSVCVLLAPAIVQLLGCKYSNLKKFTLIPGCKLPA